MHNKSLDFMKGIACFGIVYMHTSYDSFYSPIIVCLSRIAVPLFFMISGYYCWYDKKETVKNNIPRKIGHILKLTVVSVAVYFVWTLFLRDIIMGNNIQIMATLKEWFTVKNLADFLFFNQLPWGGYLWFLFALVYCYILLALINKFSAYKVGYIIAIILLFVHIISRTILLRFNIVSEEINIIWYRNFIFMGYPFFMLGNGLHKYENKIVNRFSNLQLIIFINIGLVLQCVQRLTAPLEVFFGTIIAVFFMFVFALQNKNKEIIPIISKIGMIAATYIYIWHGLCNDILNGIYEKLGVNNVILMKLNPIFIYCFITVISILIYSLKRTKIKST